MKKVINKFLTVAVSFMMGIAVVPLSSGESFAETAITDNIKYFSTTMYNFNKTEFNTATDKSTNGTKSASNFYFIDGNNDSWAKDEGQTGYVNYGDPGDKYSSGQNTRDAYNVLVQGIVKDSLDSNGQIQFNYNNAGVFAPSQTDISGRDVYTNVQFPFKYDSSTGYYEFNSANNHVHKGSTKDNETLPLYSGKQTISSHTSFFPFNQDRDSNPDYFFGMNMSVPFYINENGKDSNGNPIKFEFSGDDDVWVFINGKLVLDLGGIHDAIGGSIDFSTGNISYSYEKDSRTAVKVRNGNNQSTATVANTTLSAKGINMQDLAKGENNLQIYYLERGAGESNCKIKFNLQQRDTLEVSKSLGENTPYTDNNFEFQILRKNDEGTYEACKNANYSLYTGSVLDQNSYTTDNEGKFNLQAGQRASFTKDLTGEYKIVELTTGYETKWVVKKESSTIENSNMSEENGVQFTIDKNTDTSKMATRYIVNCTNSADVTLNDDTIVLDYGKPVDYNVRDNDNKSSQNATVYGIGKGSLVKDATSVVTGYATLDTAVDLDNGNISINKDGVVTYTPTKYMSSIDKANYVVSYKLADNQTTKYAYATVNIIPATSVYYEDDFGTIETDTDGKTTTNTVIEWTGKWYVDGKSQTDEKQDSNNTVHGWDTSYVDDKEYSNGSAHKATISDDNKTATAKFTFTGTGVDVYSRTNSTTGTVLATLYKVEDGRKVYQKALIVDNKADSGDYYQIPTLFFEGLDYGTYEVKINVTSAAGADRSTYYLDGIRVYNPLGVSSDDPVASTIVKDAYSEIGEYNAKFSTVRSLLLDASNFTSDEIDENGKIKENVNFTKDGIVFIDELENGESGNTTSVATYEKYGPKNEVYLSSGNAIAFKINSTYEGKVFIGVKSIDSTKSANMEYTNGSGEKDTKSISHASDMYYEVKPTDEGYVEIKNTGDGILSITKLRLTGIQQSQAIKTSVDENVLSYASTFSTLKNSNSNQEGIEVAPSGSDVEINNTNDTTEKDNNDSSENKEEKPSTSNSIWNKVMNSVKNWFKR